MREIKLSGGLTVNEREFRIDNETDDEVFISIKFQDDGLLVKAEKLAIGNRVLEYFNRKTNNNPSRRRVK
jgi:hypothetical protein